MAMPRGGRVRSRSGRRRAAEAVELRRGYRYAPSLILPAALTALMSRGFFLERRWMLMMRPSNSGSITFMAASLRR